MPKFRSIVVGLTLSLLGSSAWGTSLRPIADAELVRASQLIALGSVRRIEGLKRRGGRIVTEITIDIERTAMTPQRL